MSLRTSEIDALLSDLGAEFRQMTQTESDRVRQQWLHAFAKNVKAETGVWVHNRFRWHGFSYGLQTALEGAAALNSYQTQWRAPYVLFDEEDHWAYACTSQAYPDFTRFHEDIYVAHHNMKWTMVFTHESPDIGPYFAMNQSGDT